MRSLREHARASVIWNAGFNLGRDLLQFGVMLVMVRLLKPEAYGQFGMVTSILGFISMFSFNSFLAHTLQVRDEREARFQEHFTAGAFIQIPLCVITNLVAFTLNWFPRYAPIAPYLHAMSLLYLLEWPNLLRYKMIERKFDWQRLRLLHALGLVMTQAVAVVMALSGCGAWSLLLPSLMVTLPFIYDLFVVEKWRPTWAWSRAAYRPAWEFGLTRVASGAAGKGQQLIESGVLTALVGFAGLGVFNRALGLAQMFCQKFAEQLLGAIYPILTRVNPEPHHLRRVNALVLRIVAWVSIPMAVIFSALATAIVHTLYRLEQWWPVIPLLPWAMVAGSVAALSFAANRLLLSNHQSRKCLAADLLTLGGIILSLYLVLPLGTRSYLMAVSTVQFVTLTVMLHWLCRLKLLDFPGIVAAIFPALAAALMAYAGCEALFRGIGILPETFWLAMGYGSVFGLLYLTLLRTLFVRPLRELVSYVPGHQYFQRILFLQET